MRGIFTALALGGSVLVAGCSGPSGSASTGAASGKTATGGAFSLTDVDGRTVTDQTLKGKPFAIFFGFTRCPDVCPTTMSRMAQLHKLLGADADKLNIVFVSVDPEHDKSEDIKSFLSMFPAPVIGLTGTPDQLKRIETAYRVYVKREPLEGSDYTIDHTAAIYLIDRTGAFFEPMSSSEPVEANLEQLRKLIAI
ncbi:MAG: SCO family protein [Sphingomonas sp.]|jgi:protein SCO1/2|uniref:SCO family protein n=1 Tax=Sphingomonas sp. TaxID=28214 RepID=UPI00356793C8